VFVTAILVDETADPHPALPARGQLGEKDGVLHDDALLITEAVGHPVLDLLSAQVSCVHPLMKRMTVVIADLEHLADSGFELVTSPRLRHPPTSSSTPSGPNTILASWGCSPAISVSKQGENWAATSGNSSKKYRAVRSLQSATPS